MLMVAAACSDYKAPTAPGGSDEPPPPVVLLKDLVIPNLPAPYYHFAYDESGRIVRVSFASNFTMYDVQYANQRISQLHNNILVNHDRLVYVYDDASRVREVDYTDAAGNIFTRLHLAYSGTRLTTLNRERLTNAGTFVLDRTTTLGYGADGNLSDLTQHYSAIEGIQNEITYNDHFENYDTGTNVDAFGLLHSEFFDHLVLLPMVQLQKGNPRRITHTGDGDNYVVDYTYTYDAKNRPQAKTGDLVFLTGDHAGQHFNDSATYSYYD